MQNEPMADHVGISSPPTFHEIALKYGTDKVASHHYWFMYDKYLPSFREQKIKMLEIGLGCDMVSSAAILPPVAGKMLIQRPPTQNYGPGKSYYTWLEYFPFVDLYYMEYDAACAQKWASKTTGATIVPGDQSDAAFLEKFLADAGTDFDIIIDDGGHTMTQQKVSLQHLWRAIKPGGIYFVEDLETSYLPSYGGDDAPAEGWKGENTMVRYIYELIDDKMRGGKVHEAITANLRSIDCDRQICALIKKDEGTV